MSDSSSDVLFFQCLPLVCDVRQFDGLVEGYNAAAESSKKLTRTDLLILQVPSIPCLMFGQQ